MNKKYRACVTGGCGFIGSALVKELLKQGWDVEIVDNLSTGRLESLDGITLDKVTYCYPTRAFETFEELGGGLLGQDPEMVDYESTPESVLLMGISFTAKSVLSRIADGRYDVIFHQAATPRVSYSVEHPLETMQNNLMSTTRLFKTCADSNTPIVWASSSSVYAGAEQLPTPESARGLKCPRSPYAMHKYHCEDYARVFGELYGLESVGLRYFNVYGPSQPGDSPYATAVSAWCNAIKEGKECRSDGDGLQSRDMCYIDNVVQANIKAAQALLTRRIDGTEAPCYSIAHGERTTNLEILDFLAARFGDRVKVRHAPERKGDVKHTHADISRAREELGYEPTVYFWDGLERTLKWWKLE